MVFNHNILPSLLVVGQLRSFTAPAIVLFIFSFDCVIVYGLSISGSVQGFYCLFMSIFPLEIKLSRQEPEG